MPLPQQTSDIVSGHRLVPLTAWSLLTLVCCATCLAYLVSGLNTHIIIHAGLFIGSLLVTYYCTRREDADLIARIFVMGYVIRVVGILAIHYMSPHGFLALDDRAYDDEARFIASNLSLNMVRNAAAYIGSAHTAYPIVIAMLYKAAGTSVLSAKLLNAIFGALCIPVAYRLAAELSNKQIGITAAWICSFFLFDIAWSSYLLKDTLLLVLFTAAVLVIVQLYKKNYFINIGLLIILLYVVYYLRIYAIAVLMSAAVFAVAIEGARKIGKSGGAQAIILAIVGLTLIEVAGTIFDKYSDKNSFLRWYRVSMKLFDASGQFKLLHFALSTEFVTKLAHGCVSYLLAPRAWIFANAPFAQVMFYPGMYVIYFCLPLFLLGSARLFLQRSWAATFVLLCYVVYAAVEIYMYQSGGRQRMMTDVIFIVCAAIGWHMRDAHVKFVRLVYLALLYIAIVELPANL